MASYSHSDSDYFSKDYATVPVNVAANGVYETAVNQYVAKWDTEFVIENLPPWVYKNNPVPQSVSEAKARISSLYHTIEDMDIQIQIRESEKRTALVSDNSQFDEETHEYKFRKILKAKQSTLYVISALKYWLLLNEEENISKTKFKTLVELLIDEPVDFVDQVKDLLS